MNQTIPEFFSGRSILITGATGFMGKLLIEKLLRSCPEIENIYIIVREKGNRTIAERLDKIWQLPIFDKLKCDRPGILESKLVPICGNISEKDLGLSEKDYKTLSENISVIFHMAATIAFNDPLTNSTRMNAGGTKGVVDLAYTMSKLVAFVHVSTIFCNCDKIEVDEIIYPPHGDWKETLSIVENLDTATMNILSKKYVGRLPNTYVFTKSLAEHVIWDQKDKLPIVILRPSIVTHSWKEPLPGWIDNFNGPFGLMIGCAKGVIRTTIAHPNTCLDFTPADIGIKAIIVAAWHRALSSGDGNMPHIYHSSTVANFSINDMIKYGVKFLNKTPLYKTLWHYGTHSTVSKWWFTVHVYLKHLLPALVIDAFLKLSGRKPMLLKIHQKYYSAIMALSFFTTTSFNFHNSNFLKLNTEILKEDKESFDFSYENMKLEEYFYLGYFGSKKYLLKEPEEWEESAKIRARRIFYLDKFIKAMGWILLVWILLSVQLPQRIVGKLHECIEYIFS